MPLLPKLPSPDTTFSLLNRHQKVLLRIFSQCRLGKSFILSGATALSSVYLKHRLSQDIDFFSLNEVSGISLLPFIHSASRKGFSAERSRIGPINRIIFRRGRKIATKVDFIYFPFDPIEPHHIVEDIRVESFLDIAVNKLETFHSRSEPKDYVDIYFILRTTGLKIEKLRRLVKAKFDIYIEPLSLAERCFKAEDIQALPRLVKKVSMEEIKSFFYTVGRQIVEHSGKR